MIQRIPHQVQFVRLVASNRRRHHGIIAVHPMGAGKTLTTIMALMNFPYMDWVIIAPTETILLLWKRDISTVAEKGPEAVQRKAEKTVYTTYDSIVQTTMENLTSNAIVVCDEAHNLLIMSTSQDPSQVAILWNRLQKKVGKIIMLSASPFYTSTSQILDLCEIAAGKELIQNRMQELRVRKSTLESLFYGWILPEGLNLNNYMIGFGAALSSFLLMVFKFPKTTIKWTTQIITGIQKINQYRPKVIDRFYELVKYKGKTDEDSAIYTVKVLWICIALSLGLSYFYRKKIRPWAEQHSLDVREMDMSKVMKVCAPYIDIPDPSQMEGFPATKVFRLNYLLEPSVLELLNKFIYGLASPDDIVRIGLVPTLNQAKRVTVSTIEDYIMWGSQASYFPTEEGIPNKIRKALEVMKQTKYTRIVVYSRYLLGLQAISKTLSNHYPSLKVYQSSPETGVPKDVLEHYNVVLLHPLLYEGVDIAGCWSFIIMDPPEYMVQNHQLLGRTRRITSHIGFDDKSDRYCNYYYLVGGLSDSNEGVLFSRLTLKVRTFYSIIQNIDRSMRMWSAEFLPDVSFGFFVKKIHGADALPEQLAYQKSAAQLEQFANLMDRVNSNAQRVDHEEQVCNPWFPFDEPKTPGLKDCTEER